MAARAFRLDDSNRKGMGQVRALLFRLRRRFGGSAETHPDATA